MFPLATFCPGFMAGEFSLHGGEEICVKVPQILQGFGEATPIREMLVSLLHCLCLHKAFTTRLCLFLTFYWSICFTMLLVSAVQQRESAICIHVSPLFLDFLPAGVTTELWVELPMLYRRFSLLIYFISSSEWQGEWGHHHRVVKQLPVNRLCGKWKDGYSVNKDESLSRQHRALKKTHTDGHVPTLYI